MPDQIAFVADSLVNLVSNLGTAKDKATQARFTAESTLDRTQIDGLYKYNWLGGKVVDIPADDATREWRQWYGVKGDIEAIEEVERSLKIRTRVNQALKLARKDGGSLLVMGLPGPPGEPVDPSTLGRGALKFVHLVPRWELTIPDIIRDPQSPYYGQPTEYRMFLPNGGVVAIHPSRTVLFVGTPRYDQAITREPWGDSIFERCHEPIRDATAAQQAAASLLQEMKIDVIKIPGLTENIGRADYRDALVSRFSLALALKSINNSLLLDVDEEWSQKTLTLQGLPEIMEKLLQIVAGSADMPVTRLLGRSPAGMNATGEADLEAHYTMVRARQETDLRPSMEPLDVAVIRSALGRRPRGLYYEWRPLWSLRAQERSEINKANAAAISDIAKTGIFNPLALQRAVINQAEEDGFLSGLAESVAQNPGVAPPPPPARPTGE